MNEPSFSEDQPAPASREEIMLALFANMVIQQTNMAMIFLGKAPHPESGQTVKDLEAAQMFIEQLEMLEAKTRGNLDRREQQLLQQSLAAVRMTFVEAVEKPDSEPAPAPRAPAASTAPPTGPAQGTPVQGSVSGSASEEESRKKFSKKY